MEISERPWQLVENFLASLRARAVVSNALDDLITLLERVLPMADEIDRRTADFTRRSLAREQRLRAAGDLKAAVVDFKKSFQSKFDDLPEDGHDTSAYDRILARGFRPGVHAPPLLSAEIALCHRLLENPLMADAATNVNAILHAGTKGDFEQESIPLPLVREELDRVRAALGALHP